MVQDEALFKRWRLYTDRQRREIAEMECRVKFTQRDLV
jgi:hypothetical protein